MSIDTTNVPPHGPRERPSEEPPAVARPDVDPRTPRDESALGGRVSDLARRLLVPLGLALVVLVGLLLWADARRVAERLREFDLSLVAPVLGLSLANYGLRFVRWNLYLRRLDLHLSTWHSLLVFLVGFVLTITPGKVGELGKAWLVREMGGGPARRAVAAVLAERLTDLLGVFLLACLGSFAFPGMARIAWIGLAATIAATALLAWPRFVSAVVAMLGRIRWLEKRLAILVDIQDQLRRLLTPGLLATGLVLSVLAWGAEGLGFSLVVSVYAAEASWLAGLFNYSLASLAGGLAMLPGGLVATEGVLTALLGAQGMEASAAASATLIVRAATLWFAVLLGLAALPFTYRALRTGTAREADPATATGGSAGRDIPPWRTPAS
jgi:uncharacterized protein (TIRG00374 family)